MSEQNNQQLPAISVQKIESLKPLPSILAANQELLANAKKTCEPVLAKIKDFKFKDADLVQTDTLEKEINDLQVRLRNAKENAEKRRKPATSTMDEIKGLFTANENIPGYLAKGKGPAQCGGRKREAKAITQG